MAVFRSSEIAIILLVIGFVVILALLYPEWQKLTVPGGPTGSAQSFSLKPPKLTTQEGGPTRLGAHRPLELVWSFQTQHKWQYRDPFLKKAVDQSGGAICSDIVVAHDRIYFGSEGGFVYCLSLDGRPVWSFETFGAKMGKPVATQDRLFCGSEDNYLYALAPETGQQLYRFNAKSEVLTTPLVVGDRLIVAARMGRIFALGPAFGRELSV